MTILSLKNDVMLVIGSKSAVFVALVRKISNAMDFQKRNRWKGSISWRMIGDDDDDDDDDGGGCGGCGNDDGGGG